MRGTSRMLNKTVSKAAASEEARRYIPHFVWAVRLRMDLGERKNPFTISILRPSLPQIELLSEARTMHGKRRVPGRRVCLGRLRAGG